MPSSVVQSLHDEAEVLMREIRRRLALAAELGDRTTFAFLARTLEGLIDVVKESHGDH